MTRFYRFFLFLLWTHVALSCGGRGGPISPAPHTGRAPNPERGGEAAESDAPGWAWTFGGDDEDWGRSVSAGPNGLVVVAGNFSGTVDLDPGPAMAAHSSLGRGDCFVLGLSTAGELRWAHTWGVADQFLHCRAAVGEDGTVAVTLNFSGTLDLDPGPTLDTEHSGSEHSAAVVTLDAQGRYLRARVLSSPNAIRANDVGVGRDGSIVVTGAFERVADLDPGDGVEEYAAPENNDITGFVVALDPQGSLRWSRTFEGSGEIEGYHLALSSEGAVVVAGSFNSLIDLDPGPETRESRATSDNYSLFVTLLDSEGVFRWAQAWHGPDLYGSAVAVTNDGSVWVAGDYLGNPDFDPGPGETWRESSEESCNCHPPRFALRLTPSGELDWVENFEGIEADSRSALAPATDTSVYFLYGPRVLHLVPRVDHHQEIRGQGVGIDLAVAAEGQVYLTGASREVVVWGTPAAAEPADAPGGFDILIARLPRP